jgi:hypothetical protein
MSIPYIPGDPVLRWSLALDHFQACIQAVIEEGINSNSLVSAEEDEEAVRAWLENPWEVLRRDLAQTGPLLLPLAPALVRTPQRRRLKQEPGTEPRRERRGGRMAAESRTRRRESGRTSSPQALPARSTDAKHHYPGRLCKAADRRRHDPKPFLHRPPWPRFNAIRRTLRQYSGYASMRLKMPLRDCRSSQALRCWHRALCRWECLLNDSGNVCFRWVGADRV